MKIFILEDDPERMRWFRQRLFHHDVTYAESCVHVHRFVGPYDVIFFDHDLGGRQMDDHEDNGALFASLVDFGQAHVIIHSYNADGAKRIQAITNGVHAPFRGSHFNNLLDEILADSQSSYD
jgi:hypothetical protein